MDWLARVGEWIAENESVLSGAAAIIVLLGVVASAIGMMARQFRKRIDGSQAPALTPYDHSQPLKLEDLSAPAPYPIQFVKSDNTRIAYAVMGEGPPDLMLAPGIVSHLHMFSHLPVARDLLAALSGLGRLVTFDKRGQGLSDPSLEPPDLETRVRDMEAVLDAAGMQRVVLVGLSEGGTMSVQFAHDHPDRVCGLVLIGSTASWVQREDYPIGIPEDGLDFMGEHWGRGVTRDAFFPSMGRDKLDDQTLKGFERLIATRDSMRQIFSFMKSLDVRPLLPNIKCPTLVVHFSGDLAVPVRMGRDMAEAIPNAEFLEVGGTDHAGITNSPVAMKRLEEFVTGLNCGESSTATRPYLDAQSN